MRDFYQSIALLLILVATCPSASFAQDQVAQPNIILCMADDQGYGDMGYTGHPYVKTPNFDAMSKQSLIFDRFYSAAPVCSPTRASVMTGRNPNRSNVPDHGRSMRPQEITIAEALKTAGYVTGHFGKWHIGSVESQSPVTPGKAGFDEWVSGMNFFDIDPFLSHNGIAKRYKGESSMVVADASIEFLRKHANSGKPMLCVVWFASPHDPHQSIEKDEKLYAGEKMPGYYQEITAMDRAFGKLRTEIKNLGIKNNTLLWYCSDNGGLNAETSGGRNRKGSIYEGGLRVPGLIEWPARIPEGRSTTVHAYTSDIYPTLLDIADVEMPNQPVLDGESLMGAIEGEGKNFKRQKPLMFWSRRPQGRSTHSDRIIKRLYEAQTAGKEIGTPARLDMDAAEIKITYPENDFWGHAAVNDFPWKLHRIQNKDSKESVYELYNLKNDPEESTNVVREEKKRAAQMKFELEKWQVSVLKSLNGEDYK